MNPKNIFFICVVLVVPVRCDCDDYFKCLSDFVQDFISVSNDTNLSNFSDTGIINTDNFENRTMNVFDLSDIERSLSQALSDITTFIKDEIKGVFNIVDQQDIHKDIENKTEIHVRTFNLEKLNDTATKENETKIEHVPEIIVNNLTKFNDELNALKIEIEKNLQEQLETFISQVLENDTIDWIDPTENTFDGELTTTERSYPEINNNVNLFYQEVKTNDDKFLTTTNELSKAISDEELTTVVFENRFNNIDVSSSTVRNNVTQRSTTILTSTTESLQPTVIALKTTSPPILQNQTKSAINVDQTTTNAAIYISTTSSPTFKPASTTTVPTTTTTHATKVNITTTTLSPATTKTINYKLLENVKNNEISGEDASYYDIQDDNATDYPIIDYVELYKDTTNEIIDYIPTVAPDVEFGSDEENVIRNGDELAYDDNGSYTNDTTHPSAIFPWIAAIFVKSETNNQFDYICDGVLLSERIVLTAARCLQRSNVTVNPDDIIIFLGKKSLQSSAEGETIHKVKQITLHPNFSVQGEVAQSDLAAVQLEDQAVFNEGIQPACLDDGESEIAVTTAWSESLSVIRFEEKNKTCESNPVENTFCATYGKTVALCPSYGGAYASLQSDRYCVAGVRTADPAVRGICFDKTVRYTHLGIYRTWLDDMMNLLK